MRRKEWTEGLSPNTRAYSPSKYMIESNNIDDAGTSLVSSTTLFHLLGKDFLDEVLEHPVELALLLELDLVAG